MEIASFFFVSILFVWLKLTFFSLKNTLPFSVSEMQSVG